MSNPFVFPYTARIMAALKGHEPVELFRTKQSTKLSSDDVRFHVSHLDDAWEWWVERRTPTRQLISPRVQVALHVVHEAAPRFKVYKVQVYPVCPVQEPINHKGV